MGGGGTRQSDVTISIKSIFLKFLGQAVVAQDFKPSTWLKDSLAYKAGSTTIAQRSPVSK